MENPDLISLYYEIHTGRSAMRYKIEAEFGNYIHDVHRVRDRGTIDGCGAVEGRGHLHQMDFYILWRRQLLRLEACLQIGG